MKILILLLILVILIGIIPSINAEITPNWVKNTAGWWATDAISEKEFVNAIEFLVNEGIIASNLKCSSEVDQNNNGIVDEIENLEGFTLPIKHLKNLCEDELVNISLLTFWLTSSKYFFF